MTHFRRWIGFYLLVITGLAPLYAAQWKSQDIGSVSVAGSATIGSASYTVTGDGDDIWGTADAFHFLYLPMSGDGEIVARVASFQGNDNDGGWSKAGVMFRETLNAGSTQVSVDITSGNGGDFQWRDTTGGTSQNAGADGASYAPYWVRLVRKGNLFTGYKSNDGNAWTQNGSVSVVMAADIYVGLCVTAHAAGSLSTATFDHVSGNAVVNPWKPVLVSPANNADNIPLDGDNLRWGPPEVAPPLPIIRYDLYATENRAELENPDLSAPAFIASILPTQPLEFFTGPLESDRTYYWRVDTVITGETKATGEIWAFQTIRRLPQFISQPVTQAVHPGARVEFSALASSDYGAVSYTWYKQPNPTVLSTASSLVLTNVTSADNGLYVCRATNSIGSTDSNPARLIVLDRGALQAGLEAYWPLDDSLGDASGSAHDGTLVGSATGVDGIIGKALLFPGNAGNAVQTGTWNPSALTGKLSLSIWAKWNGLNGNYHGLIAKRDAWDPAQMMWQLEIDASSGLARFFRYDQANDPGVVLPVGAWHHIAVSFDGTTASIYHDGQLTSSGDFSFGTGTASQLVFGCGEAGGNNPFNGVLDEAAVWNRALSADEVAYLYNNGKGNPIFEPVVTITETAGATVVAETGASDTFTLQLAKQPTATVNITVTPATDDLELNGGFPGEGVALSFDTANWNLPQTVTVRAALDGLEEGDETVRIGFGIESADPEFHHAFIPFVQVRVIDAVEPICPMGDLDGDCQVNLVDLLLFASDWLLNKQCTDGSCGELTGTGRVNLEDLAILAENWLDGRGPVVISEFMAANHSQAPLQAGDLLDEDNQASDWIELYNLARIPMNIGGWYLTNDVGDLKKWRIPDGVSINGGTAQVIFASGKNRAVAGSELHTNFALDQAGSYLALVALDGKTVIHEYTTTELDNGTLGYPPQEPQISYGLFDFFRKERYFQPATPGEKNRAGVNGLVADTKFSVDRGFFTQPFDLELSTATPGATIRYTLDGSTPSLGRGETYAAGQPIHIAQTTVIRAAAFLAGWISSNVDTQTYLFLTDVLQQSSSGEAPGAGWPTASINGQVFDYGMDPDVVNSTAYKDQMVPSLKAIPTMSLVTDLPNLFDPTIGIYVNADASRFDGIRWEKPASLELINPDGSKGFQINCGLRIRGGYSRGGWNPKHAFRVFFRSEYGDAKLKYPLFEDEGVDTFDKFDLRCSQNYSWAHGGDSRNTNVRDEFSRDVQGQMGDPYTRTRYYHLYINGIYWGLYETEERPDNRFAASYMGDNPADYDAVKCDWVAGRQMVVTDGTIDAYMRLYNAIRTGLPTYADLMRIQGLNPDGTRNPAYERLLDIDNLMNYMILEYYTGDRDGPGSRYGNIPNNTFCLYDRTNPDGWKYLHHDNEHSLGTGEENLVVPFTTAGASAVYFNPQWLHEQLAQQNAEYRLQFADRAQKHLYNGGVLTAANATASIDRRANEVRTAMIAESARWGDAQRHPALTQADWTNAVQEVRNWISDRVDRLVAQFRSVGWFPALNAPVMTPQGGELPTGGSFALQNPNATGQVYYTLDGSDPRLPADVSAPGSTVTLMAESAAKRATVPTSEPQYPKGTIRADYYFGISGTAISDLTGNPNYPNSPDLTEYPTLLESRPGDPWNTYGTRLSGFLYPPTTGSYTFWIASDDNGELWLSTDENPTNATRIALVPAWTDSRQWYWYPEQQSAAISLTGGKRYFIQALMKEDGGGDNLAVAWQGPGIGQQVIPGQYLSPAGSGWMAPTYDDGGWTGGAGGVGFETKPNDPINYTDLIGIDLRTPMFNINPTCYIRIPFTVPNAKYTELILRVRYDDGFIAYLNGKEVKRINFPDGVTPRWDSGANLSHDDSAARLLESFDISGYADWLKPGADNLLAIQGLNAGAGSSDFVISAELVARQISAGDPSPSAVVASGPVAPARSMRVKSRVFNGQWSAMNEAVFAVGPVKESLRITEIMYHPVDPNAEYIELKNMGTQPINLNLVRFTKGVDFTFGDLILAPNAYTLVVRDRAAFEAVYGAGLPIAGQYAGLLENHGENIRLRDAAGTIIHDFAYSDGWYPLTDGGGYSLTILDAANSDPLMWGMKAGWRASAVSYGSPGSDDGGLVPAPGAIVINEILSHSHGVAPDWIELHNTTDSPIYIGGWYLSNDNLDDAAKTKFEIAAGTVLPKQGYVVFYQDQHFGNPANPGCHTPFGLSEGGGTIYLQSGLSGQLTGYTAEQAFDAAESNIAFGRYLKSTLDGGVNFVAMSFNTPNDENAPPKVGPIVFTEIQYNPAYANTGDEYIELKNITSQPVTLQDAVGTETSPGVFRTDLVPWQFTDGIEYAFPANTTIPAGGMLIVAKDPVKLKAYYGAAIPANVPVLGPFANSTSLSNGGEKVRLSRPGDQEYGKNRFWIRAEQVTYDDVAPWPVEADGAGKTLQRIGATAYGNDAANWQAAAPGPGK